MVEGRRIKRNSFFAFLSQAIRLLANVFAFLGIARLYSPAEFGQFTAAHTLSTIFIVLADFGFDILVASEISRQRSRAIELSRKYLSMKILFAVSASILMVLAGRFQQISESTRILVFVLSGYVLFSSLTNFFFALFKSFEELHHETKISFVMNGALLCAVVLLGLMRAPLVLVALAFIASRVLGLALAVPVAARLVQWGDFRFAFPSKPEFIQASIFGFHALFTVLASSQDTILLSLWAGDHEVGIYQSVIKITVLAMILSDISFYSLLPVLSRLHATERGEWLRLGRLLHKSLLFVGVPIAFVMIIAADQVISVIYGAASYHEAIPVLRIFGWAILVRYSAEASGIMLTSSRRQFSRMIILAIAVVLNLGLNSYAIPHYGAIGASMVSLITSVFIGSGYILVARREVARWFIELRSYLPMCMAIILGMLLSVYRTPLLYSLPVVLLILASVTYFMGYSKAERSLIFSVDLATLTPP